MLPVSALLAGNLFLFGTLTIYMGNPSEFNFGFLRLFGVYALPMIALMVLIMFVSISFPENIFKRLLSILFVLSILFWLQSNFLMWDYGMFDGREVAWDKFDFLGWMDTLLWITLFCLSLIFFKRISKATSIASYVMIAMQLIVVFSLIVSNKNLKHEDEPIVKGDVPQEIFRYSQSTNIIHILLDSLQTDILLELIEEENYKSEMKGFVLFKNAAGIAPQTSFAIPAIFSGDVYDGQISSSAYFSQSIKKGFQNLLYDNGYDTNLIPKVSMLDGKYTNYYQASQFNSTSTQILVLREALYLLDVSLFRLSPHFLRKKIYNNNNWLLGRLLSDPGKTVSFQEKEFIKYYIKKIRADKINPAYHFLHLWPPHPPYVTTKTGAYAGKVLPNTRGNYKNESRAILNQFIDLLKKLKKLNIYDSSMIILQGDHGSQIRPIVNGKEIDTSIPGRAMAALAVKKPFSKGKMTVSKAEISLSDIPFTIMDLLGIEHTFSGNSIFEYSDPKRERTFIVFDGSKEEPEVIQFTLRGHITDSTAWTKKIIRVSKKKPEYKLGTPIKFGVTGNAEPYKGRGWSFPETNYQWNNGSKAELNFILNSTKADLQIQVRFLPFVSPGKVDKQRIDVYANDKIIAQWIATDRKLQTLKAKIDKNLLGSKKLRIEFIFKDAVIPKSINEGGDERELAVAFVSITIGALPE